MTTEDPTDIFDTALSTLFDIPPIAFSTASPDAFYTYIPPTGPPIELKLPHPPPDLYTKLQANNLWLSGIYLADLIGSNSINLKGKRVCELGAGAGLPGIVAGRMGAKVLSTDWGVDEVLNVIRGNFERAQVESFRVVGHEWGSDPAPLLCAFEGEPEQFDSLLLADTLWVTDAHAVLLDSVYALLESGGVAHVAAGLHTGRGPLERFMEAARTRGATSKAVREVRWRNGQWEPYMSPGDGQEERGVVVYFTLTT